MFTVRSSPEANRLVRQVIPVVKAGQLETAAPALIELLVRLAPENKAMDVIDKLNYCPSYFMGQVARTLNKALQLNGTPFMIAPDDMVQIKRFVAERSAEILEIIEKL